MPLIKYNYRYVTVLNRFIISNNCNQIRFFNKFQALLVSSSSSFCSGSSSIVLVLAIFLDPVLYLFIVWVSVLVLVQYLDIVLFLDLVLVLYI